jgi:hypothetical protein
MSTAEWIVTAIFAVWFVATVGYQFCFDAMYPWVSRFDWFHLLPALNFFSVVPRLLRLSYRDRTKSGELTAWRSLHLRPTPGRWRLVWNPGLIAPQVVSTGVDPLIEGVEKQWSSEILAARYPHRLVSRAILAEPRAADAVARQFRVLELAARGEAEPQVLFTSEWLTWAAPPTSDPAP